MNKDNIFKSSEFYMAEGDILHMLITDETGSVITFTLNSYDGNGIGNENSVPDDPVAMSASNITVNGFTANWYYSENALGYYLDVATDIGFTSLVAGYNNLDVGFINEYDIIGLNDGTDYFYRLRAYNDIGVGSDSNIIQTTTSIEVITDFDGNIYSYVTIGTQQWLIENLKTTHYNDGTPIPNLILNADWIVEDGTPGHDGAYCWYDNDAVTNADYGILYNAYAAENAKGIAPSGWRVPSDADWSTLVTYLGGGSVAGGILKEQGLLHWLTPNNNALDSYGFKALPGGYRDGFWGDFDYITRTAIWFSTDEPIGAPDSQNVWSLSYSSGSVITSDDYKRQGSSIRCVRDV